MVYNNMNVLEFLMFISAKKTAMWWSGKKDI